MNDLIPDGVAKARAYLDALPQFEPVTRHYFADGMYCREVFRPAGVAVVGRVHKREHFYMVTQGKVLIKDDHGAREAEAPAVIVSKPGTQRVVIAMTDATCLTVHRTDKTDLDAIADELLEADPDSRYTTDNKPLERIGGQSHEVLQ